MVEFYYYRVKEKKQPLSKVPKRFREDVKQLLLDNGYGELVEEE